MKMPESVFVFGSKKNEKFIECTKSIELSEQIFSLEWSPFSWSEDLLCIGHLKKICVASCKFQDDTCSFDILHEFYHDSRVHCISWSPQTSLVTIPKQIVFGVGGSDYQIRIFESDLLESHNCKVLSGHKNYINDIKFEPEGRWIASVSDDHSCCLWSVQDQPTLETKFNLNSPGLSVCWHTEDSGKLLVAEKSGVIRLYNVITQVAILSVECIDSISSANWCQTNSQLITAITRDKVQVWDVSNPNRLINSIQLHFEHSGIIKFGPSGEFIAVLSLLDGMLKVCNIYSRNVVLTAISKLATDLSWHNRLQLVCVADDNTLRFWKIPAP